ncbi:hypothetical protein [Snodgrassella alvi]|uniref:hypothetical protein n=1 Tax=Snodgrassella alvi TaxID=1196083 RepID=UPI0015D5604D|nr:hypothetical protein [Snodgrassella alvi]
MLIMSVLLTTDERGKNQPQILTKEQLKAWSEQIKTGELSAIGEVYQALAKKG